MLQPRPWRPWQPTFNSTGVVDSHVAECRICRVTKETFTCTVKGYRESGQETPVLKIEVCEECLG